VQSQPASDTVRLLDVRRGLAILWLAVFGTALVRTAWVGDDAFFTFRTIDNLVHGYGLRWNVAERVQAYTHPLWLLLLTPFYFVTREPYFTSIAVSIVLTLLTVWLLLRRARSTWSAAAGLMVLLGSRAFLDYSTSGLENPLTHVLLAAFLLRAVTERQASMPVVLLAALLLLNRLDLAFLVVPVLVRLLPWREPRRAFRMLVPALLPLAAWELFSLVYYGFPFPNTAYAKVKTGVAEAELFKQGVTYLLDSAARDPLTLLVIVAVATWTVLDNPGRTRPIGVAIFLHLTAVTAAGGDFMSGRMFAAPLLAAVVVLVRLDVAALFAYPWMPTVLAAAIGVNGFRAIAAGAAIADARDIVAASGVSDERAAYFRGSGLIGYARDAPFWPRDKWIENGLQARAEGPRVIAYCCNGMFGYAAGPAVHIVDTLGLGDPLMARLPAQPDWRVGHFNRLVPRGYTDTLESHENRLAAPQLAAYYTRLALITRGPIWNRRRLETIVRMNLGGYESLLNEARPGSPVCAYTLLRTALSVAASGGRASVTAEASLPSGCAWNARSSDSWLRLPRAASGTGTGTLNFDVEPNPTTARRVGTIVIAWPEGSASVTVAQEGLASCSYSVAPAVQTAEAASSDFALTVTPSNPSCAWKADADVPWIAITSGGTNAGTGTVVYRVQPNATRAPRTGSVVVKGFVSGSSSVAVTQSP